VSEHEKQTDRITRNVQGFFTPAEGRMLYHLAQRVTKPIVEIGSFCGKSTIWLARGSQIAAKVPVIAIDNFAGIPPREWPKDTVQKFSQPARVVRRGGGSGKKKRPRPIRPGAMKPLEIRETFERNIEAAGVADIVTLVPKTSKSALKGAPKKVGLLFIDGCHDYEGVKLDFDLYSPLVVAGGWIAFHDQSWPGPSRVIEEELTAEAGYEKPRRPRPGLAVNLCIVRKLGGEDAE
jgi:predicted O-methyltransferase YrrM